MKKIFLGVSLLVAASTAFAEPSEREGVCVEIATGASILMENRHYGYSKFKQANDIKMTTRYGSATRKMYMEILRAAYANPRIDNDDLARNTQVYEFAADFYIKCMDV
jgi:hypothetical protein